MLFLTTNQQRQSTEGKLVVSLQLLAYGTLNAVVFNNNNNNNQLINHELSLP